MKKHLLILIALFALSFKVHANTSAQKTESPIADSKSLDPVDLSFFDYKIRDQDRIRSSTYWFPLLGYVLPGFPQYLNHQVGAGLVYSGIGTAGIVIQTAGAANLNTDAYLFGYKTYETGGALSAYHAFRSTVQQRQEKGDFDFLKTGEESNELMLAPFQFGYFLKPTTFIPLAALGGLLIALNNADLGYSINGRITGEEALYTAGISYGAGVSEELMFRGYLMMNMRESWDSDFWSAAASGTIFGLAHLSDQNRFPLPQLVLGYYFGWLVQHNDWTLSEAIFLHTWWDVIAFAASYASNTVDSTLWFPPISLSF